MTLFHGKKGLTVICRLSLAGASQYLEQTPSLQSYKFSWKDVAMMSLYLPVVCLEKV
jgi:hypothetical protein